MEKRNLSIDLDTATRWYNSTDKELKALALETFPELGIKPLPKTWEELDEINGFFIDNYGCRVKAADCNTSKIVHKNVFATKEQAEASLALAQLSQLKKVYNCYWEANWEDTTQVKYCIYYTINEIRISTMTTCEYFLSFKDLRKAELFLENFIDLIKQAKPLMS
jgi:hypothetical protein